MGVVIKVGILTAPKIEFEQREHTFLLKNVRIGIGFHWDRYEDQEFAGDLEIIRVQNTDRCADRVQINLLEVNTTPGMTPTSFIPQQVRAAGLDIKEVLTDIIENKFSNL